MRLYIGIVLLALSSIAFAHDTAASKVTTPGPASVASLTPELFGRILALIGESGADSELSGEMATALGFSVNGQPWLYRQTGARADESDSSTPLHIFAINRGNGEDVLIYLWADGVSHFIRARRNGQVVEAITVDAATGKSTSLAITDAQIEVNSELRFWDRNAEKTGYWRACEGQLAGANPIQPEKKIAGCTWLIQSGKETPAALAMAYVNRSMAYTRDDAPRQMDDLNQAVKEDPKSATAWAEMCSAQNWVSKDEKQAIQACSKAIEFNPQSPEGWTYRGDIYLRGKDYDLAIADYDRAIKLGPQWMWPWDNRGEAYLRKNQFDRAIQDFNEVIRLRPDYAMGYLDRGRAEIRKDELDEALTDFQSAVKVDPKCGSCLLGQGLARRAKGDIVGGDADIANAKVMNPKAADGFVEDGIPVP